MIKLIVDSTCDLPEEWKVHFQFETLPLIVSIDDKDYLDGEEISLPELHEYMRKGGLPKTAQVPSERMHQVFERQLMEGNDLIYLSFSSAMSGTYQLAFLFLEDLKAQYPGQRMELVDSRGGCLATGLIAARCGHLIESGADFDTVVAEMKRMALQVEHLFTVPDLTWLVKGGRIPRPAGVLGNLMDIKPILDVQNGKMCVIKMVRGRKKSLHFMVDRLAQKARNYPDQTIAIAHCNELETALLLSDMIRARLPECQTVISEIGCVLSAHLGIGGVGLFYFREA